MARVPVFLLALISPWAISVLGAPVPGLPNHNDFSCSLTATHPNPVIMLHGLGATYYTDLNSQLEAWLQARGFCTFSVTYGAYDTLPFIGGLKPLAESSQEIARFVVEVQQRTGANKVDLVGHSEGALQALYTSKFGGISPMVDTIVAIAPPTHGTNVGWIANLAYLLGNKQRSMVGTILDLVGCAACDDVLPDGPAVKQLNDGQPIAQPGNAVNIITSRHDELVTPTSTAFVLEPGVRNMYVQDMCPLDVCGHLGEGNDLNVWHLTLNALERQHDRVFACAVGSAPL